VLRHHTPEKQNPGLPCWTPDPLAQAHAYEVHPRFGSLQASTDEARLQLAALYAATATRLPEPASQAAGAQIALDLVRRVSQGCP
jgi:hypothetical protein